MTKKELKFLLTDTEILSSKKITEEEASSKDPQMIYHEKNDVYEWEPSELTHEEIMEALMARQTLDIRSIRTICSFFLFISLLLIFLFILLPALR